MKKIFILIFFAAGLLSAQNIEVTKTPDKVLAKVKDSTGVYRIGINMLTAGKTDAEIQDSVLVHLAQIKGRINNPPPLDYIELRKKAYPPIEQQLDMIYWDMKNGTSKWINTIDSIKAKYPKK